LSREFGEYKATKIDGVSGAEAQQEYTLYFQRLENSIIGEGLAFQAKSSALKKKRDAESTFDTFAALVAKDPSKLGGDEGALQQLTEFINSMDVSSDQKAAWLAEETDKLYLAQAKGTIFNTKTPEEAEAFFNELDLPEWQEKLGDKWAGVKLVAQHAVNNRQATAARNEAAALKESSRVKALKFSELILGVYAGTTTEEQVDAFYLDNQETLKQISDGIRLKKAFSDTQVNANGVASIFAAFMAGEGSGESLIDHNNPKTQGYVDEAFISMQRTWKENDLDPAQILSRTVHFAGKLGVVPSPVKGYIESSLRQDQPIANQVHAAEYMQKLFRDNQMLRNEFNERDIKRGLFIIEQKAKGTEDSVMENMLSNLENMTADQIQSAESAAKASIAAESGSVDVGVALESIADPAGFGDYEIPLQLREDWISSYQDMYVYTYGTNGAPDEETSKSYASENVKKVWGYTGVGSTTPTDSFLPRGGFEFKYIDPKEGSTTPRLARYPVEKYYGVRGKRWGANTEWINEQLVDHITGPGGFASGKSSGVGSSKKAVSSFNEGIRDGSIPYYLVYNPVHKNNKLPTYTIMVRLPNGNLEVLNNGEPWVPEYMGSNQQAVDEANKQDTLEKARELSRLRHDQVSASRGFF